jgi:hypothetical protein
VDPVPEREVLRVCSREVEDRGIPVQRGIPVRGGQVDDDLCAHRNRHAADLDRVTRVAERRVWDGRVVRAWLEQRQLVSSGPSRKRDLKQFVVGQEYTFDAIALALGGRPFGYLAQVGSRIVCGRFTMEMNPRAPYEILVGDPPGVRRKAEMLAAQGGVIPAFIKEGTNRWRYHGPMEVVGFETNPRIVRAKAKEADRDDVVGVLSFRDAP